MENGPGSMKNSLEAMPQQNTSVQMVNGDACDNVKNEKQIKPKLGTGNKNGSPNSRPGTPKSSPRPGTPKSNPRPGTPKSSPRPGTPKSSPRPGTPKSSPRPGTPRSKSSKTNGTSPTKTHLSVNNDPTPSPNSTPKPKLVLHFDVRNTVLVADSVTNVNVEQALNSFLTGVTWGNEVEGQWEWFSDQPSLTPPNKDVITYYKHLEHRLVKTPSDRALLRQVTGDFTQEPIGEKFHSHFEQHLKDLRWPYSENVDKTLIMAGSDGTPYHYILPAFFKMIHHLQEAERDFCIIIRTYGLDAPNVLACTEHTLKGNHPQFPNPLPIEVNSTPGKVFRTKTGKICFEKYLMPDHSGRIPRETFTDEQEIYRMLCNQTGVSAFVDDFIHWQDNNYHHKAGKPVWVDPKDPSVHHIIFDDNIRTTDLDSIVDLRIIDTENGTSKSLELEETVAFENMCLVQADLLESTSNVDYFIEKLRICEHNYSKYISTVS